MALELINVGSTPNDGSGDPVRVAFQKTNINFQQLFSTQGLTGLANGTSNLAIPVANGSVTISSGGTANVFVVSGVGANVQGTLGVSGTTTLSNLSLTGAVVSAGTIQSLIDMTASNVIASANMSANNMSVTNSFSADSLALTGNVTSNFNVTTNLAAGNIISPGTVSATGNLSTGSNVVVAGNVITGGFLIGDGGFLSNITAVSNLAVSQLANGTTVVSVVSSGGNVDFTVGGVGGVLTVRSTGTAITGTQSVTGNITGGNIVTTGTVQTESITSVGNITGGNIIATGTISAAGNILFTSASANSLTSNTLAVSGNINSGNLINSGIITSTGNITTAGSVSAAGQIIAVSSINGGNLFTSGVISAAGSLSAVGSIEGGNLITPGVIISTGNITGGNLVTAGLVSATGNITGGNLLGTIRTAAQPNITSVGTLGALSVTGNITGGNILTPNAVIATLLAGGNLQVTGDVSGSTVTAVGNITGGNLITAGLVSLSSITKTGANSVGNIGQIDNAFNTVFARATSAQYADLAEMYCADADYPPGTVLSFGGAQEVTISSMTGDARVAGVVSAHPAHLMNSTLECDCAVAVALTGRVPTQVTGPVRKGDMMVSAGNGHAQACATPAMGTVIGKALEDFEGAAGTIEIVVGRL